MFTSPGSDKFQEYDNKFRQLYEQLDKSHKELQTKEKDDTANIAKRLDALKEKLDDSTPAKQEASAAARLKAAEAALFNLQKLQSEWSNTEKKSATTIQEIGTLTSEAADTLKAQNKHDEATEILSRSETYVALPAHQEETIAKEMATKLTEAIAKVEAAKKKAEDVLKKIADTKAAEESKTKLEAQTEAAKIALKDSSDADGIIKQKHQLDAEIESLEKAIKDSKEKLETVNPTTPLPAATATAPTPLEAALTLAETQLIALQDKSKLLKTAIDTANKSEIALSGLDMPAFCTYLKEQIFKPTGGGQEQPLYRKGVEKIERAEYSGEVYGRSDTAHAAAKFEYHDRKLSFETCAGSKPKAQAEAMELGLRAAAAGSSGGNIIHLTGIGDGTTQTATHAAIIAIIKANDGTALIDFTQLTDKKRNALIDALNIAVKSGEITQDKMTAVLRGDKAEEYLKSSTAAVFGVGDEARAGAVSAPGSVPGPPAGTFASQLAATASTRGADATEGLLIAAH